MHIHQSSYKGKALDSQQATRNPTTSKKVMFYTPVQRGSQKRYFSPMNEQENKQSFFGNKLRRRSTNLNNSMYQLSERKQQCIRSSRYQQAKRINQQLQTLQRKRARTQVKRLISQHKEQKKLIKQAYSRQIRKFQQTFENYFIGLKAKQQTTMIHFKKAQQRDIRHVQQQLVEKCKTLKVTTGEIKSLQKTQKKLRQQQRFEQLVELKKQKKLLKVKLLQEQQDKIYCWAKSKEDSLKTQHTKKYNALVNRIEEIHNDKYRFYQKERHMLRLKYHNVLKKLDHSQKIQFNQLVHYFPYAKSVKNRRIKELRKQ